MTIQPIRAITRTHRASRIGEIDSRKPIEPADRVARRGSSQVGVLPQFLQQMERLVGYTRAKEIWKLKVRGVQGTLPELSTYVWLEDRKLNFEFQSALMGGRRIRGGAVVDFLLFNLSPNGYYVWRVQGDHWHAEMGTAVIKKDEIQKARLNALKIGGVPVVDVIDLWESRIYKDWPNVFLKAEAGIELGRMT